MTQTEKKSSTYNKSEEGGKANVAAEATQEVNAKVNQTAQGWTSWGGNGIITKHMEDDHRHRAKRTQAYASKHQYEQLPHLRNKYIQSTKLIRKY